MREIPVRLLLRACVLGVLLGGCVNLVKQAEAFYQKGEPLLALRVARAHINDPDRNDDEKKRFLNVMILSARALLAAPDTASKEEAFELFEALPAGSEEKQKAAQRLLRVMAHSSDVKDLQPGLLALEPEMGEEAQVRSNLRLIVEQTRGTQAAVWAARTVVERWPDDSERWVDLAGAQAGVAQWKEALDAVTEAHQRLHAFCEALPQRMAGYDKVRRLSAYGQYEIKRCQGFAPLALRVASYAQHQKDPLAWGTRHLEATAPAKTPCPAASDVKPVLWDNAPAALMVSPQATWWLDGAAQDALVVAATPGNHVLTWRAATGCLKMDVEVAAATAVALRTLVLDVPVDARPAR